MMMKLGRSFAAANDLPANTHSATTATKSNTGYFEDEERRKSIVRWVARPFLNAEVSCPDRFADERAGAIIVLSHKLCLDQRIPTHKEKKHIMKINQKLALSMAWLAGVAFVAGCCCCQAPEPPSNGVQIQVDVSSLSEGEIEDLKDKLADIAGGDSNMSTVINGAATWNYTTDLEPQAFADKIDFATVTSVADRVITLDVSSPPADDGTADGDAADGTDDAAADGTDDAADATADAATDSGSDADGS